MDNPTEFNYTTTDKCDGCDRVGEGTMLHANDASGWATPVLFQCNRCSNPPLIDRIRRRVRRVVVLAKYYWRTDRAERQRHRERKAEFKRRTDARKAAKQYTAGGPLDLSHFVKQK